MKKIIYLIVGIALVVQIESCETTELDLTLNPNALTEADLDADNLLVTIQESFARHINGGGSGEEVFNAGNEGLDEMGMDLTRIGNFFGQLYNNQFQAATQDDEWNNAYRGVLETSEALITVAEEQGLTRHIGMARFFQAYTYSSMVDFFGDIPFNDALQAREGVFAPTLTPGADVYAACFDLLDQADANFTNAAVREPANDLFYNNDFDKWQLATNTLRLKLLAQTRLVDSSAEAQFNAIIASGNYIQSTDDDFQFQWGTNQSQPETRHPRYVDGFSVTGSGDYIANWYMERMFEVNDPRLRYIVYRQTNGVPGSDTPPTAPDAGQLGCSVITNPPPQYLAGGFTFCSLDNGYWGRDHGSEEGIPADGFLRSTWGVYPFGGRFDDSRFEEVGQDTGAQGAGITPILTAHLVQFLQAEMAMAAGNEVGAGTLLQQAVATHIDKVQNSGIVDPDADDSFEPTEQNVTDFLATVDASFQNANTEGKWNVLGEQFLRASVGMGIDAYNFYRRSNYPTVLQPNINPNPGTFMNSVFYPANSVNTNSNISQKPNNAVFVFWDTNGTPPAN
ncbi:SusD/RagB family nutrient-binding outer membrane lipoprotein [Croceitalea rosinachiae]|uniref:SusD/RagB family nutrient-binding outer membrane lipoprotein n=1 Tax=Croceitalea rosinachiae TaxID=3075596 RepID=A0ABU3ACL5_9FLAO|nr:SusD/RagB family nutrient-binding outer membrane lipoprotein [Croceitalea sp. F388]MDT0607927.1 SusD/RagB family nutrient-binding outer membrane lipoprotein [Croceitalea sp. F388]